MKVKIRPETEADYAQIFAVVQAAFGRANESRLVDMLRHKKEYIPALALVAEHEQAIIGHILFFPVEIHRGTERLKTLTLAPLAVHPDFQKKGVGSQLSKEGLAAATKQGFHSVTVIGHPTYYPRFGFERASKWRLKFDERVPVPDEAFMAKELVPNGLKEGGGTLVFPQEFFDCM